MSQSQDAKNEFPNRRWRLRISLDAPFLNPPAVLWALFTEDPQKRFHEDLRRLQPSFQKQLEAIDDASLREQLLSSLVRTAEGIAGSLRCKAQVTSEFLTPPVLNDPALTAVARQVAEEIVGAEGVIQPDPFTGSDDLAYFWQKVPGCYAFVGSARPEWSPAPAHHNAKFDIDESAMEVGADFLVRAARRILAGA